MKVLVSELDRPPSAVRTGLLAGAAASVLSTAALAMTGKRDADSYTAPTNATSHWLWRDEALRIYRPTWRHTAAGYAIHHLTATFWAVLYAWLYGNRPAARPVPAALKGAAVATAVACTVDYTLTPERFTPGFEHHLSKRSMTLVYAGFALGLALGCIAANRRSGG
ncbi:MAG: hypothetical protein EOO22_16435 [Comamonadaceae bacterium]|nr:MAG: hypothetical protein EOO22_16435 [Comamonadaceae bacterium]